MSDSTNLLADESIWQHTFDALPDLIFILDREQRIVRANRAAALRLGCPAGELVGRACCEVIHGTAAPPDGCPVLLLRDGQPRTVQVRAERL